MAATVNEPLLEERLAKVEEARSWSARVISKLENHIRTAGDDELFRINPIEWAGSKGVAEDEAVDLFLHSAKVGLFTMDWIVVCPCCSTIMHSLAHLHNVQPRNTCTICMRDDVSTLDDYVQVVFTIPATIRDLRYHHPETLELEDYVFKYMMSTNSYLKIYGKDMPFRDLFGMIKLHLATVPPGETARVETDMMPGSILFANRAQDQIGVALIALDNQPATEPQMARFKVTGDGFESSLKMLDPNELRNGPIVLRGALYSVKPGPLTLELEQATDRDAGLCVWKGDPPAPNESGEMDLEMAYARFTPCLTAKRLFACQTFHDLFRSEVFQESQGFSVKDVIVLFTDLKSSTQLYNQIGDLNAFALVREHYGVLHKAIMEHHGAVVKTIGDAIMATFNNPKDAVSAGLAMLDGLRDMNATSHHGDLELKVGIHRGAAISVTLNERIDYFGQTVNTASRVQGIAGGGEIYITSDIYGEPDVPPLFEQRQLQVSPMELELKGIDNPVKVYKVAGANRQT